MPLTRLPLGTAVSGNLPAANYKAGSVIQVVQTHLNTTSSQSISADTVTNITDLNATITPSSTNSKVRITVRWSGESSNLNNYDCAFGIKRGSTIIGNPASAGNRIVGIASTLNNYHGGDSVSTPDGVMYEYLDSPGTTSATTYYATIRNRYAVTLVNQSSYNTTTDNIAFERLTSTITLEEIAG